MYGVPHAQTAKDQFGNGFMQYYPSDSIASVEATPPAFLNFSRDPSVVAPDGNHSVADQSNFFWYHQLGNVGFLGFSGAASLNVTRPYLEEACASFAGANVSPQLIFVVGHWTLSGHSGCAADMGTPDVWALVKKLPGCDGDVPVKYLMGHDHCNKLMVDDGQVQGYLVGASGAGWGPSNPVGHEKPNPCPYVGFIYFDSTHGREEVTLFNVFNNGTSVFPELRQCFAEHGIGACTHLGEVWTNVTLGK